MTKTTNYQLNQWAKSDRIMMDDFNADNAKIDAALLSKLGPIEDILTYTQSEVSDYPSVDIPLPENFDWGKWSVILMDGTFQTNSNVSNNSILFNLIDAQDNSILGSGLPFTERSITGTMLAVLFPARNEDAPARGLCFPGGVLSVSDRKLREAVKIRYRMLDHRASFPAAAVRLRGIR